MRTLAIENCENVYLGNPFPLFFSFLFLSFFFFKSDCLSTSSAMFQRSVLQLKLWHSPMRVRGIRGFAFTRAGNPD